MSTRITREELRTDLAGTSIDVARAADDPRLANTPVAHADVNDDGRIQGEDEVDRLFALLDRHDRDGRRRSVRVRHADGRPTSMNPRVQALADLAGSSRLHARTRADGAPTASNDRILYVGMNHGEAAETEALGPRAIAVRHARDAARTRLGGRRHDLSTERGVRAFARTLHLSPERTRQVARALLRAPADGRDELAGVARVWARAERGAPVPDRLVLSGHHVTIEASVYGPHGELSVPALAELARALPRGAAAVEDLHVSACNYGHPDDVRAWRRILPNLRTVWAYAGTAPGAHAGATTHLRHWEQATRGRATPTEADPARIARTRRGDSVALWDGTRGYRHVGSESSSPSTPTTPRRSAPPVASTEPPRRGG